MFQFLLATILSSYFKIL